jgi:hypothetical protein
VVEGSLLDQSAQQAVSIFEKRHYEQAVSGIVRIHVTQGPIAAGPGHPMDGYPGRGLFGERSSVLGYDRHRRTRLRQDRAKILNKLAERTGNDPYMHSLI